MLFINRLKIQYTGGQEDAWSWITFFHARYIWKNCMILQIILLNRSSITDLSWQVSLTFLKPAPNAPVHYSRIVKCSEICWLKIASFCWLPFSFSEAALQHQQRPWNLLPALCPHQQVMFFFQPCEVWMKISPFVFLRGEGFCYIGKKVNILY